jgi:ATP-binding cassette, subfamily B, bacterial
MLMRSAPAWTPWRPPCPSSERSAWAYLTTMTGSQRSGTRSYKVSPADILPVSDSGRPIVVQHCEGRLVKAKLRQARAQLPYIPATLRLIWSASRPWTIAWLCLLALQGLLPVALVYLTGSIADGLGSTMPARDWSSMRELVPLLGLLLLVLLLMQSLGSVLTWVRTVQGEQVQDHIVGLIHAKAVELDLAFYDSPEYYDRLYRASVDAYNRPVALLENAGGLAQGLLTLGAMSLILLRFAWWVPVVLILGMLPVLAVVARASVSEYLWQQRSTEARRRTSYYDWLLTDRGTAAELRLFGLGDHFQWSYQAIRGRLRDERAALSRARIGGELLAGSVALLSAGVVMLWTLRRLLLGDATLGDAAILYQAFSQGQRLAQTVLANAAEILRNVLFVENLFGFLKLEPSIRVRPPSGAVPVLAGKQICFENVSFSYPGSERPVLHDLQLTIPAGQIAAVVGANGAGKSTLLRLLCRFYDPDRGRVLIDGTDVRQIDPAEIWRQTTVLLQEPVRYDETVRDNIGFGDILSKPSDKTLCEAARAAGAEALIARLPAGYDTVLGKWFGGMELSTGEWQRIALARACLRRTPIMLLDEPTSAMDSWAEADWMSKFRWLAAGKTAVLITHRFTTAMQADIIHVMDAGRIIESGAHQQLLHLGGKYAHSWREQMRMAAPRAQERMEMEPR